jgi:hypothetical protein
MVRRTLLTLMIFVSLTIADTSKAALGWTLEECKQHFGRLLKHERQGAIDDYGRSQYYFESKGFIVFVYLLNGIVSRVGYLSVDGYELAPGKIDVLLQANSDGTWLPPKQSADQKFVEWDCSDGCQALYLIDKKMLVVFIRAPGAEPKAVSLFVYKKSRVENVGADDFSLLVTL